MKSVSKSDRHYVVGMAGHIDHGKTSLVQALTGINTDRLKEEQERGITVDLGFAHFDEHITIIDVPGHERLIKNMVAGVATIDMVLFVVAADDGIMPQTREHLDIVRLLDIKNGMFVITKTDLVDEEWLLLVDEELRELLTKYNLNHFPVMHASPVKGDGISEVRAQLLNQIAGINPRKHDGVFRLPIDRVFKKSGFGTVVTGSVLSGKIKNSDVLEILPEKLEARVRGIHSHDHEVTDGNPGYRIAINLAGIEQAQIYRGQVLTEPGFYEDANIINARIQVLAESPAVIKNNMRLRLHIYTTEVLGRILLPENRELQPGDAAFVQIKLEKPVYASFGDLFVIRQYSPQATIGGGRILQINPVKFRKRFYNEFNKNLTHLESGKLINRIPGVFSENNLIPFNLKQIAVAVGGSVRDTEAAVKTMVSENTLFPTKSGQIVAYYSAAQLNYVLERLIKILSGYHKSHPGRGGIPNSEIESRLGNRFSAGLLEPAIKYGELKQQIKKSGQVISLFDYEPALSEISQKAKNDLVQLLLDSVFSPPKLDELQRSLGLKDKEFRELMAIMKQENQVFIAEDKIAFHVSVVEEAQKVLKNHFEKSNELTVADFRVLINASRKYAIPLITRLDNMGITSREGDIRRAGPNL